MRYGVLISVSPTLTSPVLATPPSETPYLKGVSWKLQAPRRLRDLAMKDGDIHYARLLRMACERGLTLMGSGELSLPVPQKTPKAVQVSHNVDFLPGEIELLFTDQPDAPVEGGHFDDDYGRHSWPVGHVVEMFCVDEHLIHGQLPWLIYRLRAFVGFLRAPFTFQYGPGGCTPRLATLKPEEPILVEEHGALVRAPNELRVLPKRSLAVEERLWVIGDVLADDSLGQYALSGVAFRS